MSAPPGRPVSFLLQGVSIVQLAAARASDKKPEDIMRVIGGASFGEAANSIKRETRSLLQSCSAPDVEAPCLTALRD